MLLKIETRLLRITYNRIPYNLAFPGKIWDSHRYKLGANLWYMDTQEARGICSLFQSPSSLHTNILLPPPFCSAQSFFQRDSRALPTQGLCRHQSFCLGCSAIPLWLLNTYYSSGLLQGSPWPTSRGQIPVTVSQPWSSALKHLSQSESDFWVLCIYGYLTHVWFLQCSGERKVKKTWHEGRQICVWICLFLCPNTGRSPNMQKGLNICWIIDNAIDPTASFRKLCF